MIGPLNDGRDHPLWTNWWNSAYMYTDRIFKLFFINYHGLHKLIHSINPFITIFKAQKRSSFIIKMYTCNMDIYKAVYVKKKKKNKKKIKV